MKKKKKEDLEKYELQYSFIFVKWSHRPKSKLFTVSHFGREIPVRVHLEGRHGE